MQQYSAVHPIGGAANPIFNDLPQHRHPLAGGFIFLFFFFFFCYKLWDIFLAKSSGVLHQFFIIIVMYQTVAINFKEVKKIILLILVYVCMYVCVYVCMYVCMCMHVRSSGACVRTSKAMLAKCSYCTLV